MTHKSALGKGLDALLPDDEGFDFEEESSLEESGFHIHKHSEDGVSMLALEKVHPNPDQPRKNFDQTSLEELAASIKEHGIIEPIIVEDDGAGSYTIIAGERRARAANLAGLGEIPALVRHYGDKQKLEISLIENIQREDLNPVEEAQAYQRLMEVAGLSQEELAERLGKARATIANSLRLLKLPNPMLEALKQGALTPGHGRALLAVEDEEERNKLFEDIMGGKLSVRAAEARVKEIGPAAKAKGGSSSGTAPKGRAPELEAMEEKFLGRLGTKVKIEGDLNKGRVVVEYYSMEDLERIYEVLGGSAPD
jgi:ParB family chromosome partitioning protein